MVKKFLSIWVLYFAMLLSFNGFSQESNKVEEEVEKEIIQFSGFVMSADSLIGIPFVHMFIKGTNRGSTADFDGYFSFAAHKGDTIVFTAIGFRRGEFVIPADLDKNKYSAIQLLTEDTVYLAETLIFPWPTREQFKDAFLTLDIPDDDLDRALKNLEAERLAELGETIPKDGNESNDYFLRQEAKKFYYAGQAPPMQIFNVFAWAKFIQAWKNGDFKRKKKKKKNNY